MLATSTPFESATLLTRLADLRREPTMRAAREWYLEAFWPERAEDVEAALRGAQSAAFRMVTSYWDMAAALVLHGAIDEAMFHAASREPRIVFAKLEPFLPAYRTRMGPVVRLVSLERLVLRVPGVAAELARARVQRRPSDQPEPGT